MESIVVSSLAIMFAFGLGIWLGQKFPEEGEMIERLKRIRVKRELERKIEQELRSR